MKKRKKPPISWAILSRRKDSGACAHISCSDARVVGTTQGRRRQTHHVIYARPKTNDARGRYTFSYFTFRLLDWYKFWGGALIFSSLRRVPQKSACYVVGLILISAAVLKTVLIFFFYIYVKKKNKIKRKTNLFAVYLFFFFPLS